LPAAPQPAAAPNGNGALAAAASIGNGSGALLRRGDAGRTLVRFWLKFHVDYGQSVRLIGGNKALGQWDLALAPALGWSEGDLWNATLELDAGARWGRTCVAFASHSHLRLTELGVEG